MPVLCDKFMFVWKVIFLYIFCKLILFLMLSCILQSGLLYQYSVKGLLVVKTNTLH